VPYTGGMHQVTPRSTPPAASRGRWRRWPAFLLLLAAGCSEAPERDIVRALPAEASLDARGLDRGRAAERPASVQVQHLPDRGVTLFTVAPRLQTGSPGSLPMVVTSFGAERQDATGALRASLLLTVSNARGYGGFSRAESRQGGEVAVRSLGRTTECQGPSGCLYVETLLLTPSEAELRRAVEAGAPLRIRVSGNASYVEATVPPGHLRALFTSLAQAQPGF
jgi:hypothetical protein